MKILVIGGGGREHALAWKAAQSAQVEKVFLAPGNAGSARDDKLENVAIDVLEFEKLANFAESEGIELSIVGPEAPLVDGVVDYFEARGLKCFGPSKGAAQLEGSKAFTKDFLARHNIPTAAYESFTEVEPALDYLRAQGAPIVVKADGLAAGKGVIVAEDLETAEEAVKDMLSGNAFGDAGCRVVIEEFVSRSGTDYGLVEASLKAKVEAFAKQLEKGEAILVFNRDGNSCEIVSAEAWQQSKAEPLA